MKESLNNQLLSPKFSVNNTERIIIVSVNSLLKIWEKEWLDFRYTENGPLG